MPKDEGLEAAKAFFEQFNNFVKAGFTEDQALSLIAKIFGNIALQVMGVEVPDEDTST